MPEYKVSLHWDRGEGEFSRKSYKRNHLIRFPGGQQICQSAAPEYQGDPSCSNPEEAFLASLSSCHMLTFLAIAALKGFVVESYEDEPVGLLAKNDEGRMAMTRITLRPRVVFASTARPDAMGLERLHASAHRACFIANSLSSEVVIADRSEV